MSARVHPVSQALLDDVALSRKEYRLIVRKLGRAPTPVELGMFGSLWSEHCGYKHSRPLLKLFPSRAPQVLVGPGEENAGAVDIGDGLALVFKVESHNHPSAIEPYEGAATGVGGIVRDIFTMGARPLALLNSLRFGPLTEPRNRYLFGGVVAGIAGYGNCLGIPDVGGEVYFSPAYAKNPLVNAMCVGLMEKGRLIRARAAGVGNPIILVGADTGRDGIHGASGLASRTFAGQAEMRSAVQVGNPFLEKLLIEACLELAQTDYLEGMQDLGAAGLTSASVECAGRGGSGVELDVAKVPRRETGMNPYEVMLSESQERMLVIARQGCEDKVKAIFAKWDLRSDVIGRVTADGLARIKDGAEVVAEAPVALMQDAPAYRKRGKKPREMARLQRYPLGKLPDLPWGAEVTLRRLLGSPNLASRRAIYRQYDHQVMTNTVIGPGGDAALLRLKGTKKAIALSIDGNGRYCYLDPYAGGAMAVAEAARNVICTGARPLALTNCLNFGNPERPEIYYQLEWAIRGMAEACRALGIPVISGNVSLYNETDGQAIYPTPVVGMAGLLEDLERRCAMPFRDDDDLVALIGPWEAPGLAGSEYLELVHGLVAGRPALDLELERRAQGCALEAIGQGLLHSAHDCSDGGLLVALAECVLAGGKGFVGESWEIKGRKDNALFGEAPSRFVVSLAPKDCEALETLAERGGVPCRILGRVGGQSFIIPGWVNLPLADLEEPWRTGLERALT